MKRTILAVVLTAISSFASVSANAAAQNISLVCGNTFVQILAAPDSTVAGIQVNETAYVSYPDVMRNVDNGELYTTFHAERGSVRALITSAEDGTIFASLREGKKILWKSFCRRAN